MPEENLAQEQSKKPLLQQAWVQISGLAAAAIIVSQLLDVPNKLLDTYLKIGQVFNADEAADGGQRAARSTPKLLSGAIFDPTGRPLPGVDVLLPEYGLRTRTDTGGRFSLEVGNPISNLVSLRAEKGGFQPLNRDVPLGDPAVNLVMKSRNSE